MYDDLIVDALGVHILKPLPVTEGNGAGEVGPRGRRQIGVLDQVPHLRHETVGVNVHGLHSATGDEDLTALARGGADLAGAQTGVREATAATEQPGGGAGDALEKVSAI